MMPSVGRRVLVVGAGIMGAAIAYHLADRGVPVIVVERGFPARGTTGVTFSRLSAFGKTPHEYFVLNRAGMAEHRALAESLRLAPWRHDCGSLLWEMPGRPPALARQAETFQRWGYELEWWDDPRELSRLGDDIRLPPSVGRVLHLPAEGWVDAPQLTHVLIEKATANDAEVRTNVAVMGMQPAAGAGWLVELSSGAPVTADVVVNAAGLESAALAALAGTTVELQSSNGLLIEIDRPDLTFPYMTHVAGLSIRPCGPGRFLVRSDQIDQRMNAAGSIPAGAELVNLSHELWRSASAVLPALRGRDARAFAHRAACTAAWWTAERRAGVRDIWLLPGDLPQRRHPRAADRQAAGRGDPDRHGK